MCSPLLSNNRVGWSKLPFGGLKRWGRISGEGRFWVRLANVIVRAIIRNEIIKQINMPRPKAILLSWVARLRCSRSWRRWRDLIICGMATMAELYTNRVDLGVICIGELSYMQSRQRSPRVTAVGSCRTPGGIPRHSAGKFNILHT